MHGRFERTLPGISNRPRGQSHMDIGIVPRLELHILVMQGAEVGALEQLGINDAGIGIEGDPGFQPVVVDAMIEAMVTTSGTSELRPISRAACRNWPTITAAMSRRLWVRVNS